MSTIEAVRQGQGLPPGAMVSTPPRRGGAVGAVVSYESKVRTMARPSEPAVILHLRSYDDDGAPLPPLDIELRGEEIDGELAVGDWIQLPQSWSPGRALEVVTNLTTGQTVMLRSSSRLPAVGALVTLLLAASLVFFIASRAL